MCTWLTAAISQGATSLRALWRCAMPVLMRTWMLCYITKHALRDPRY